MLGGLIAMLLERNCNTKLVTCQKYTFLAQALKPLGMILSRKFIKKLHKSLFAQVASNRH